MKKKSNEENFIDDAVKELVERIQHNEKIRLERKIIHPKKVTLAHYHDSSGAPAQIGRFAETMVAAHAGKVRVAGSMVITHERGHVVDVVNFTAANKKYGSSWNEHRVEFDNDEDKHTFRIEVGERTGTNFTIDEGPDVKPDDIRTYTLYHGFGDFTDMACRLIPREQDEGETYQRITKEKDSKK